MKNNIFRTYQHKKTGMEVKACKYKPGLEDGFTKGPFQKEYPYILCHEWAAIKKVFINYNDYIVLHKSFSDKQQKEIEYKFVFDEKTFKIHYKLKREKKNV